VTPDDLGEKIQGQIWNQRVLISRYRNYQKKIVTLKGIRINQRIPRRCYILVNGLRLSSVSLIHLENNIIKSSRNYQQSSNLRIIKEVDENVRIEAESRLRV
jgi:hypothetical protein